VFIAYEKSYQTNPFYRKFWSIELNLIEKIVKYFNKKHPDQYHLDIFTKDFRHMQIIPRSYPNMDEIYNNLFMIAFPTKFSSSIFAFKYKMIRPKVPAHDKQIIEKMMKVAPEHRQYVKLPSDEWNVSAAD